MAGQAERLPPHNAEAEEYVLGAMMLSGAAIDACAEVLKPTDFYRESHGHVFATCLAMRAEGQPVDVLTLASRLESNGRLRQCGGRDRIRELATVAPAVSNAAHHARLVKEESVLRRLGVAGSETARAAYDHDGGSVEQLDRAESAIFDISRDNDRSEFVTLSETIPAAFDRLRALYEGGGADVVGVPSGLADLDELTSGFHPGNLIVIAGRPSMGKSALWLGIASHLTAHLGVPVAAFSLEMTRDELTNRLQSLEGPVDGKRLRTGRLDLEDWGRVTEASSRLQDAPLYIDDGRLITFAEIRSKCRRLKVRRPDLGLVVLDYLQLMDTGGRAENRVQDIGQLSRSLKVLAGDIEVPVIALSQLSRAPESRHDHRPMLSDLRESGAIEQDADTVLMLYRDEYYHQEDTDQHGIAEINVAKQRNGPTGTVKVAFSAAHARFSNLAYDPH